MKWEYAAVFIIFLCTLLIEFFLHRRRTVVSKAEKKGARHFSFQKEFSQASANFEERLRLEQSVTALLFDTVDHMCEGVAFIDRNHLLTYGNKTLWHLYAVPEDEVKNYIGKSWLCLHSLVGQEQIIDTVLPTLHKTGSWSGETHLKRVNGGILRARLSIYKTREGFVGIVRDVTDRYRAEKDRENMAIQIQHEKKLEVIERSMRVILHEFSNGLSSINGFSEMLGEDLKENPEANEYADKIYHCSHQLQGLVQQMRGLVPRHAKNEAVSEIIEMLPSVIGELKRKGGPDFEVHTKFHLEKAIIGCDNSVLHQLLFNLLQNAIEASKENRDIHIEVENYESGLHTHSTSLNDLYYQTDVSADMTVRLLYGFYDSKVEYVHIKIEDQGEGIPLTVMQHIFDPFFSTRKQGPKTGLGMSIVRSAVKRLHGFMQIESIPNIGTTISLLVPLMKAASASGPHTTTSIIRLPMPEAIKARGGPAA